MVKFLKLANRIINPRFISSIFHYDKKDIQYVIHVSATGDFHGFNLFGAGAIFDQNERIVIFKEKQPECYKAVDDWVKSLD